MPILTPLLTHPFWQRPLVARGVVFGKYVGVQLVNYALDLGLFALLLYVLELPIWLAAFLSRTLSGIFTFFCHKYFTFTHGRSSQQLKREAMIYFAILFAYAPVAAWLVQFFNSWLTPIPAKIAADIVSVIITFNLTRYFVFPKARA